MGQNKSDNTGRVKKIRSHGAKLLFIEVEDHQSVVPVMLDFGFLDRSTESFSKEEWTRFRKTVQEGDHYCTLNYSSLIWTFANIT